MTPRSLRAGSLVAGFTIIELLVATVVFSGLLLILAVTTNQTAEVWRRGAAKVEQFQGARRGFESMTRRLSQATLNTYWDYDYEVTGSGSGRKMNVNDPPLGYSRQSELRFRSGLMEKLAPKEGVLRPTHGVFFQAPLGLIEDEDVLEMDRRRLKRLGDLLNSWGYFVEVGTDEANIPTFLKGHAKPRIRSRLMQFMEPTERARLDDPEAKADTSDKQLLIDNPNWDLPWNGWFADALKKTEPPVRVLSENIIALIILPRLSQQDEADRLSQKPAKSVLSPLYDYDSKRNSNRAAAVADPLNPKITGEPNDVPEAVNPKNQLPPVVTVAMVAIDEMSAQRLRDTAGEDPALGVKWEGLFTKAQLLEDDPQTPEPGDGDLHALEQQLIAKRLHFRTYTSNVTIRGAKWSRAQK